ncbi:hypothetical protein B0T11DRAFT_288210 [Plectosphaerella cucumerina]|uniref:NACHT domain-containing protein n=1 Tax=Plectosphaerella cucumerina TaxID=40658 RepID=A0A8K0T6P9_9PEZI|nr:hypothetical protein B0T11DRAFT_288210 [Plectosphaerella cucumerina]
MAAEALGVASSVIAIVDMSFKIIHLVGRYMSGVRGAKDDMRNLVAEITECHTAADEMDKLLKDPKAQGLRSSRELASMLDPARVTLKELLAKLEKSSDSSLGRLRWPQMKDSIEDTVKRLARARERMLFMMNVDQTRQGQNIEHRIVIDNLPTAEGAAFDSHAHEHNNACMPDTRVELLEEISQWIDGTDSRLIFWLNGMAGTGKSTISQTVARSQSRAGRLGASFFFKKGEAGRGSIARFMSTLARQLADSVPGVGPLIKAAVDKDPDIGKKLVQQQFDKLIREPLATVLQSAATTARIVFVIDALDECEKDADIRLLVQVLASATSLRSHLRFFLTSRPDLSVRLGFRKAKDTYQDLVLHDIPESIVEHDLAVFFRNSFDLIRSDFNTIADTEDDKLPTEWPGDETVHELVSRSKPLFIFAATLCRFVSDPLCGNPKSLLGQILSSAATGSPLSQTYRPVLDSQLLNVPTSLRAGIIKDFVLVVGSIVILAEPLGISNLASLLGESRDTICDRLRLLHAVLRVPQDDSPVRLLHLSFRDYLLDPSSQEHGANQFHVDEDHTHRTIAERCICVMREHPLHQNIAGLSFPGMQTSDVSSQQLASAISPALHYACRYWIHHWTSSSFQEYSGVTIHEFLKQHLLYWFEAMSLLGHLGEALNALHSLLSWMQEPKEYHSLSDLSEFLLDAIRFLRSNFHVIGHAPLQIYASALALSPTQSIVKSSFISLIPRWLTLQPPVRDTWDACLVRLECPEEARHVTFSHDSKRLAVLTWGGNIFLFNVETGEREASLVLEEHEKPAPGKDYQLAFSRFSEILALALGSIVYLWTVQTGNRFRNLKGYDAVRSISFSADSKTLFTSIDKGEIRAWDLESGACTVVFDYHHGTSHEFVNCHHSTVSHPLLLAYEGGIAHIYDTQTNDCQATLVGHTESALTTGMASSHNNGRIVIQSSSGKIGCWNAMTGEFLGETTVPEARVFSVKFCGQSQSSVATTTERGSIHLWNIDTGETSEIWPSQGSLGAFAFSPNEGLLATCDRDILIWGTHALKHQQPRASKYAFHPPIICDLIFSNDSRVLVSSSHHGSIRIWDVEEGCSEEIPERHLFQLPQVSDNFTPGSESFCALWESLGNTHWVTCVPEEEKVFMVKFSKTFDTLAVVTRGEGPCLIQLWDVMTQQKAQSLEPFREEWDELDSIFFSDDSTMLAAVITGPEPDCVNLIAIWDVCSGACVRVEVFPNLELCSSAALFLPDGKKLACVSNSSLCLWDLESGARQWGLEQHKEVKFCSLASSSDSKRLFSTSDSGTKIWIWDVETLQCNAIIMTPGFPWRVHVLPGNRHLATDIGIISIDNDEGLFRPEGLGYNKAGWITWDGLDWFWLPSQYRAYRFSRHSGSVRVQGDRIALGCESGDVVFFGINGAMG